MRRAYIMTKDLQTQFNHEMDRNLNLNGMRFGIETLELARKQSGMEWEDAIVNSGRYSEYPGAFLLADFNGIVYKEQRFGGFEFDNKDDGFIGKRVSNMPVLQKAINTYTGQVVSDLQAKLYLRAPWCLSGLYAEAMKCRNGNAVILVLAPYAAWGSDSDTYQSHTYIRKNQGTKTTLVSFHCDICNREISPNEGDTCVEHGTRRCRLGHCNKHRE